MEPNETAERIVDAWETEEGESMRTPHRATLERLIAEALNAQAVGMVPGYAGRLHEEVQRAEKAEGERDRLQSALDGACLCEACAAKYAEVTGEPHRQRYIAETAAHLASITEVIQRLPAALRERDEARAEVERLTTDKRRCHALLSSASNMLSNEDRCAPSPGLDELLAEIGRELTDRCEPGACTDACDARYAEVTADASRYEAALRLTMPNKHAERALCEHCRHADYRYWSDDKQHLCDNLIVPCAAYAPPKYPEPEPGKPTSPVSPWRPIATAPKDGTTILVRFVADPSPRDEYRRRCLVGTCAVLRHCYAPDDGWQFAHPVGFGGIPDEWLAGWMPLPGDGA